MRLLASLHHYLATVTETGVQLHQYASSTIRTVVPAAGPVELAVETSYPWSGTVAVDVVSSTRCRVDALAPDPGMGPGRDPSTASRSRRASTRTLTRRWRAGDRVVLELDVSPRLTAPNPRIDAVRGCVALERGPIVYCIEQHDLPAGVDLADVAVDPSADPVDSGPVAQLGGLPGVALAGVVRDLDGWRQTEYRDLRELPAAVSAAPTQLLAVPYFAWANRDGGGMRVWIPVAD